MNIPTLHPNTLSFYRALAENNNKPFWDSEKKQYEAIKKSFEEVIAYLLKEALPLVPNIEGLKPKDCMFRPNRDVRFSTNKDPYKINISGVIAPGGKKHTLSPFYIHIQPEGSFFACGAWMPEAPRLAKLRQELDYNGERFLKIIKTPAFKNQFILEGEQLKKAPKGYDIENPMIEFLRYKTLIAITKMSNEQVLGDDFALHILKLIEIAKPFNDFINEALFSQEEDMPLL